MSKFQIQFKTQKFSEKEKQWTTCASFFDAPGYGTQKDGRHFRLESKPGRGRSSGAERNRVGPNGADRETDEGDERAIYPVRRHVPTGGRNSRKSSINEISHLSAILFYQRSTSPNSKSSGLYKVILKVPKILQKQIIPCSTFGTVIK